MLKYVTVFHEEDDLHEEWVLSDNQLMFRCVGRCMVI